MCGRIGSIDIRTDCEEFEPKQHKDDSGDCQTDGHYLCKGCKHIASFENMDGSDSRITYYPELEILNR